MVHFPFPRGHSPETFSFLFLKMLRIYAGFFHCVGFSLVEASEASSLVKVHGL